MKLIQHSPFQFPRSWHTWVEETIPAFVKRKFSPKESWKGKPFSQKDIQFFFSGIAELSDLFTVDRQGNIPPYFNHKRFRSAYLLYFMPLQAAKFFSLFEMYRHTAMKSALDDTLTKGRPLRVLDVGAGPGTASFALICWLLEEFQSKRIPALPKIELTWIDTDRSILQDGKELLEEFSQTHFPFLKKYVSIKNLKSFPWWEAHRELPTLESDLLLMGHVLNEGLGALRKARIPQVAHSLAPLLERTGAGGALFVEVASPASSQFLSSLRDELTEGLPPTSIWGPCLHAGKCPLARGRDWCHFSIRAALPGAIFRQISRKLSTERTWLKFSYLWLASKKFQAPLPPTNQRRVVSDLLPPAHGAQTPSVLLCEPDAPKRLPWRTPGAWKNAALRPHRGDLLEA